MYDRLLNLGCGRRCHPAWTNVDFVTTGPGVVAADLTKGVPFPDGSFDVVYHSHVLEHFSKTSAGPFLAECRRVLRPGGIIRVAVPDLEAIVRAYLDSLERARGGDPKAAADYDWMVLEMYDQTVRDRSGGEWLAHVRGGPPNPEFILSRVGTEARQILVSPQAVATKPPADSGPPSFNLGRRAARAARIALRPRRWREAAIRALLGSEYGALQHGRFRRGGEVHLWMYDGYSLARLLAETGFTDVRVCEAQDSRIPGWGCYHLDTEPDGSVYKPDSVFLEATRLAPTVDS